MKITPKPWDARIVDTINDRPALWEIQDQHRGVIATVESVNAADAHLIAAAPTLYNALDELHLAVTMRPSGGLSQRERAALDSARAAIAKVRSSQTLTA